MFMRALRHLLPTGWAWRLPRGHTITKFFEGLVGLPDDAKKFIDDTHDDIYPDRTRDMGSWEEQFGLRGRGSESVRRQEIRAAWRAMGGQSPAYIQGVMQEAGFPVYVHEYWNDDGSIKDPRSNTNTALFGTARCMAPTTPEEPGTHQARCTENSPFSTWRCNRGLANFTGYLVNKDLSGRAPPPIPDDPGTWPYFLYIGGEEFNDSTGVLDTVSIQEARQNEFERLLLKMCPTQHWIVLRVDYVPEGDLFMWDSGSGWDSGVWV